MSEKAKQYRGVSLPVEIIEEIKHLMEQYPELGYTSISEFIKEAVRDKIISVAYVMQQQKISNNPEYQELLEEVERLQRKLKNLVNRDWES